LGRLLTSQQLTTAAQRSGAETPYTSTYTYNLSGALISETYPSGRVVASNYNQDGELESVWGTKANQTSAKLYLSDISANSAGAILKMRLGNGRWETAEYNTRQQVAKIGLGYSDTDKSLLKLEYDYGTNLQNNGSLRQQKISYAGLSSQITQDYTYDSLNRLQSATETVAGSQTPTWKQTFDYDRYGNRTFNAGNTTTLSQNVASKITNPAVNTSDNRLKKDQDNDTVTDYDYDKNGNLTLDAENKRFVYDAQNRQTAFFLATNNTQTPDAAYEYDGEGKRVRKISAQTETIFVYNANGQLIAEYSNELPADPKISYLTSDHLGSPRIITDEGGIVVSRHDYMAFGDELQAGVASRTAAQGYGSDDEIRKQYTSYERDKESGLDYAQARYYNSKHGRFTSIDPLTASASIRNPQTFNRYSYVLNSPYKFTDPLGLISINTGACGMSCINSDKRFSTGEGMTGTDRSISKTMFAALDLSYAVGQALSTLSSAEFAERYTTTVGFRAMMAIKGALQNIFDHGNNEARKIAAEIINSGITIDIRPADVLRFSESANVGIKNVAEANKALAAGNLTERQAMGLLKMTIGEEELSNPMSLEANLVHEGNHAMVQARILSTLSTGNPKKYENETRLNDEIRAKSTAARYLRDRGGAHAQYGYRIGLLDVSGKKLNKNFINNTSPPPGTLVDYFKAIGVKWR